MYICISHTYIVAILCYTVSCIIKNSISITYIWSNPISQWFVRGLKQEGTGQGLQRLALQFEGQAMPGCFLALGKLGLPQRDEFKWMEVLRNLMWFDDTLLRLFCALNMIFAVANSRLHWRQYWYVHLYTARLSFCQCLGMLTAFFVGFRPLHCSTTIGCRQQTNPQKRVAST